jgi:hypothetical protein
VKIRSRILAGALAFGFLSWASPASAVSLRINVPKVELELAPGESYSGEIVCENPTADELKLKIYQEDWTYKGTGTGEKEFTPVGSTPSSSGAWVTFAPAEETLMPYGRVTARYTVNVPKDTTARGARYSVLFFETIVGSIKDEEGANVLVAGRVGALFFIRVKGTVEHGGRIRGVEVVPPRGNSPLEIRTDFENTGNVDITLEGNFLVMDADANVAARGDLKRLYTMPGGSGSTKTEWVGRLSPGNYSLLLTYDLGMGQTLVEEKTLVVE